MITYKTSFALSAGGVLLNTNGEEIAASSLIEDENTTDEISTNISTFFPNRDVNATPSTNYAVSLLNFALIFVFVLAVAYFITKYIARGSTARMGSSNMKVLEAISITPQVQLQIVKIGEKHVVVSVNKGAVSYICEVNKEDLTINDIDDATKQNLSFENILKNIIPIGNNKAKEDNK